MPASLWANEITAVCVCLSQAVCRDIPVMQLVKRPQPVFIPRSQTLTHLADVPVTTLPVRGGRQKLHSSSKHLLHMVMVSSAFTRHHIKVDNDSLFYFFIFVFGEWCLFIHVKSWC